MRKSKTVVASVALFILASLCYAKDDAGKVRKVIERSTLNQPGTKPFHLKAVIAPTRESDRGSNRTGEVEIWWASPTRWRREVRSPEFHQIAIVNGSQEWQKNEGDYFPEWLRETAVALVQPVPYLEQSMKMVNEADVKTMFGNTYYAWMTMSTDGHVEKGMGATIAVTNKTGLLFYGGDLGWGALFKDYKDFHGRMVAMTLTHGTPEVTARVTTLEELRDRPPGIFDANVGGGDVPTLQTVIVEERVLLKSLLPVGPVVWPPLKDGAQEGVMTTDIVVDRAGRVREIGTIVTDNNAMSDAARRIIAKMQFTPYLQNGVPVQVVSRITMPFKASRP